MAAGDLPSVSMVKEFLKQSGTVTDDDALLQRLVTRWSLWTKTRINRDILLDDYSRRMNGTGQAALFLPQYPVVSVTSLSIDSAALIEDRDFWFDDHTIYLIGQTFPRGSGNVRVTWRAGYATVPEDLDEIVAELVAFVYRSRDRIGAESKAVGGETITYIKEAGPKGLLEGLDNWRNVVPA